MSDGLATSPPQLRPTRQGIMDGPSRAVFDKQAARVKEWPRLASTRGFPPPLDTMRQA